MHVEIHILLQALAAAVLGGLLGWERENAGKWAGLRTHILVAVASMLFIRLGQLLIGDTVKDHHDYIQADPTRLIEAVAAGIAFLGAGTILKDSDNRPRGLTTAASLLLTGSLGIAVALDRYILAFGLTILCLIVLRLLNHLEKRIPGSTEAEKTP